VTIEGEVSYPGEYVLSSRNETLYQLIKRSGGFTATAFPTGLVLERGSIDDNLARLRIPQQLERSEHLSEDNAGNLVRESLIEYESNLVNRIILDMDKIMRSGGTEGDVVLEPGDNIYVPTIPSGITVMGAVGSNGTIQFVENQNVKYYVKRAGNFTPQADKKHTRLIKASGEVVSSSGTLRRKVSIGDVIVVPTKIERERNWGKTFTTLLTTTTGVLTSILLINKL
jgi:protein involved in polysaccharide export with SLBB domain